MDIQFLRHFSKIESYEEKLRVIRNGRPTPELKELKRHKGTKVVRTFHSTWYTKKDWLCGCKQTNMLFCFPCLLFAQNSASPWVTNGYCDLNNLTTALSKHEKSSAHYESQISLKTFASERVDSTIDKKEEKMSKDLYNKKVKENREILNKLIAAVCFLVKQELPFRGGNESKSSLNRGNYIELLNYTAKFDERLAHHLQTCSVFYGASNRIQNDLIEAISIAIDNNIKEEITRASFVAIEIDETTDVSNKFQCSTVLRYVLDSEIKEAFVGFDELKDRTATDITECVFINLNKYDCAKKLVAQTYDGASVLASHLNDVQAKVKEKASSALFTYCYAHKLNMVLSQSASLIPECALFFKTIEGLVSFFKDSTKLTKLLDDIVQKRIQKPGPTKWSSKPVPIILHHHSDLCRLFQEINNNPLSWDSDILVKSNGFHNWLRNKSTYFLLMIYDKIFNKTDVLSHILHTRIIDIAYCVKRINETINSFEKIDKDFDSIYDKFERSCKENNLTESNCGTDCPITENRPTVNETISSFEEIGKNFESVYVKIESCNENKLTESNCRTEFPIEEDRLTINETNSFDEIDNDFEATYVKIEESFTENNLTESNCTACPIKKEKHRIFCLIVNNVLKNIKVRYNDLTKIQFISLFDCKKFEEMVSYIDVDVLESLENYANYFDLIRLRSDLAGIHNAQVFRDKSIKDLLAFIFQNELEQTFSEVVTLLQLVLTIPATNVSTEKSFSALKRIKTFTSKSQMTNERLSALALISIEKERLIKMEQNPFQDFYEIITNIFINSKDRRIELVYK